MRSVKYFIATAFLVIVFFLGSVSNIQARSKWVGTWVTAEQLAERNNNPPAPFLENNSLRQIVQVSIGGKKIRVKFSNEFSTGPVTINSADVAVAVTSGSSHEIIESTLKELTFNGQSSLTMEPGEMAVSDPISFKLDPRENVAITIRFGQASSTIVTSHPGSRTASYLKEGQTSDFSNSTITEHWYVINAIETEAGKNTHAVAILGNSITDGRGSTTNEQNRWTDVLSERLLANKSTKNVAVMNLGLGGNCVLNGGLGPTALVRYNRDLFQQEGVKWIILFEGVNDLGGYGDAVPKADRIIEVFKNITDEAHEQGIYVYGATIMPFNGNGYYSENHEEGRQRLNNWIRQGGYLDGVIDFDKAIRNPSDTISMIPAYIYQNDWLHPNAEGHKVMGECVDLELFKRSGNPAR